MVKEHILFCHAAGWIVPGEVRRTANKHGSGPYVRVAVTLLSTA
jgi:hypothetical protein